jgi:transcriptional regulator with XRE-family HTH domain
MKILEHKRHEMGLSQARVGARVKLHPSAISAMEHGRYIPSPYAPSSRRLAKLVNCPFEELLREHDDPTPAGIPS